MIAYGARARNLPAPPAVVWEALVDPHRSGSRPWLRLSGDEVAPTVIESEPAERVVWSSLWPSRPRDRVLIELARDQGGCGTVLHLTLLTPDAPPDASTSGHIRKRTNHLLFADLRLSFGQ